MRRRPIPPEPGEDETVVDGEPPDITIPPDGGDGPRKIYINGKPSPCSPNGWSISMKMASW